MKNRIDELRKKKGLTWDQLSAELNMSKSVIWRFGNGERELKQNDLKTICDYFEVSPNYLLGYSDLQNINDLEKVYDPLYIKIYDELKDLDTDSQEDILSMISKMKEIIQKK